MIHKMTLAALSCLALLACDKGATTGAAASASVAAPAASSAPAGSATAAAPSASASAASTTAAAPSAAPAGSAQADTKAVVVTVKDPTTEPQKSVKASLGGTVTVYLPDYPGTSWSVDTVDKSLGKAKEEVIPGFAPGTNGHQFQWAAKGPPLKAGESHKVQFVNKKAGKPNGTFGLTIDVI